MPKRKWTDSPETPSTAGNRAAHGIAAAWAEIVQTGLRTGHARLHPATARSAGAIADQRRHAAVNGRIGDPQNRTGRRVDCASADASAKRSGTAGINTLYGRPACVRDFVAVEQRLIALTSRNERRRACNACATAHRVVSHQAHSRALHKNRHDVQLLRQPGISAKASPRQDDQGTAPFRSA